MTEQTKDFCQICNKKISLYRCPACLLRTCSLECCLAHKTQTNCNGKRDRTAFVPLHKFTDSTLSSDFHFLEDVLARSDRGKRLIKDLVGSEKQLGHSRYGNKKSKIQPKVEEMEDNKEGNLPLHPLTLLNSSSREAQDLHIIETHSDSNHRSYQTNGKESLLHVKDNHDAQSHSTAVQRVRNTNSLDSCGLMDPKSSHACSKHQQTLVQKAKDRNIRLLLMPQGMQRHMMNKSTRYDQKKDIIYWKVEIVFHVISGLASNKQDPNNHLTSTINLERISENDVLYKHVCKEFEKLLSHSAPSQTRSTLRHFRDSKSVHDIKNDAIVLMKRLPCQSSHPKFVKVNLKKSLREILNGMAIIEYPSIDVILPEDKKYFPLMIEEL